MKLALAVLASLAVFVLLTWVALEAGGVAVVETRSSDHSLRSTHVWFVETDAELWLEAGSPGNAWFVDIQKSPTLTFTADERSARYMAEPVPGAVAQQKIRSLLREKYGIRDWWVSLLVDSRGSVAVRLTPLGSSPSTTRRSESVEPTAIAHDIENLVEGFRLARNDPRQDGGNRRGVDLAFRSEQLLGRGIARDRFQVLEGR